MLKRALGVLVVVVLLVTAGAGGWLVAGGPLQGAAEAPATVDPDTAAEIGFNEPTVDQIAFDERVQVAGIEKRIDVSAYTMSTTNPETGTAVLTVSLPGMTVAGVSLNPLTYAPLKQTVTYVLPYLPIETPEVTHESDTTVIVGGEEVSAGEYSVGGDETRLIVARNTMDEDTVFSVGVYSPSGDGREAVEALLAEITHR